MDASTEGSASGSEVVKEAVDSEENKVTKPDNVTHKPGFAKVKQE